MYFLLACLLVLMGNALLVPVQALIMGLQLVPVVLVTACHVAGTGFEPVTFGL